MSMVTGKLLKLEMRMSTKIKTINYIKHAESKYKVNAVNGIDTIIIEVLNHFEEVRNQLKFYYI